MAATIVETYQSDIFTLPLLMRGLVQTFLTNGVENLLSQVPLWSFEGQAFTFNHEENFLTTCSAANLCGSDTDVYDNPTYKQTLVPLKALRRASKVCVADVIAKSNINDYRAIRLMSSGKKITYDFLDEFIHGSGNGNHLYGLPYWTDYYQNEGFQQTIVCAGSSEVVCSKPALQLHNIHDLITRGRCSRPDAIFSDRSTFLAYNNLLRSLGGTTPQHVIFEDFGVSVVADGEFSGIPWFVLDAIGQEKIAAQWTTEDGADDAHKVIRVASSASDVEAPATTYDPCWLGFSKIDECRCGQIVEGANTYNIIVEEVVDHDSAIVSFVDDTGAPLAVSPVASAVEGTLLTLAETNATYALKFGEVDGLSGFYAEDQGDQMMGGRCLGSVTGFTVKDLGLSQFTEEYLTRLTWYGNFVSTSPWAIKVLTKYSVPQFSY